MPEYGTRDAEENDAVRSIQAVLPEEHHARIAYANGASTIELTHLVGDQTLCEQLKEACLDGTAGSWIVPGISGRDGCLRRRSTV